MQLYSERAQATGLELALALDPAVHTRLRGDPERLRQIISNLLSNAIKFTPQGKVAVNASERAQSEQTVLLRVEIRDTGIGIDAESQKHIFEPFRQADGSTTRRFGGTGLGLTICKQLVELLGGQIGLNSTPGVGSMFWFEVPFALQQTPQQTPYPEQPKPQAVPPPDSVQADVPEVAQPGRLLLVEDNPVNQAVAQAMLAELGWECDLAENGKEAVDALRQRRYAGVLMDCQMPVMDGFAATRVIRAMEASAGGSQHLPVIALTAHAMEGDSDKCLEAGMDAYLSKPYTLRELQHVLDSMLPRAPRHDAETQGETRKSAPAPKR
jgi:CheY-like chemotaxis protein